VFALLEKHEVSNVVIVSGDVHYAQIYANTCSSIGGQNSVWEFTSSGMSHT